MGACFFAPPSFASTQAPHVATTRDTEACAICHRAHSAASTITVEPQDGGTLRNALIGGSYGGDEGDTALCFSCHDGLGATEDLLTVFGQDSAHVLAPFESEYGPQYKYCNSCHDSHGAVRKTGTGPDGEPYPALLESAGPSDDAVRSGDEFCATCHMAREGNEFPGLTLWRSTAHSQLITIAPDGTGIVCSVCHEPHGSEYSPLISAQLVPPSVPATYTVDGGGRELCLGCHTGEQGAFKGGAIYATSSHGASTESATVEAEWATDSETRLVGECQVCHNPMGAPDAEGDVIPSLVRKVESALCLECHDGSTDGIDLAQFEFPDPESSRPEIAMIWDPERIPEVFSTLSLFAAETTGTAPREFFGPREWPIQARTGNAAAGDIDSDGFNELIVADAESDALHIFSRDAMNGLQGVRVDLSFTPSLIAVADLVDDASGRTEVAVVTRGEAPPFSSELRVLRFSDSSFSVIDGPYSVGDDVTGLASGDVTGTVQPDLAITSAGDQMLRIVSEATFGPGVVTVSAGHPTRRGPRGPSIGDALLNEPGSNEIVVANSEETTGQVSVFDGAGQEIFTSDVPGAAGAFAWDTLVADVVPQSFGAETSVAMRHTTGMSSVEVFDREGGGSLGHTSSHETGIGANTASLDAGDVDADGMAELVVGNAGYWGYDVPSVLGVAPSVRVFSLGQTGSGSVTSKVLRAGGAELAGGQPDVVVADLGPIGHSGHPTNAATGVHKPDETAGFAQHAECADCHNTHASQITTSYAPPYAPATNRGASGLTPIISGADPLSFTETGSVTYEYELCFKCHSSWTRPAGSWLDVASEFDPRNTSYHGIMEGGTPAEVPAASFVATSPAWTNDSVMLCTTCHTNADASKPRGPHDSKWSPMLAAPYSGVAATDSALLCYSCHKYDVYVTGTEPLASSNFYDAALGEPGLHALHVGERGFTCIACHVNHGSSKEHLVREGLDWYEYPDGGACYTPCHAGGTAHEYSRIAVPPPVAEYPVTAWEVSTGSVVSGTLADLEVQDGNVVNFATVEGPPSLVLRLTFGSLASPPTRLNVYGQYTGTRRLAVELWDFEAAQWVEVGRMPDTTGFSLFSYPLIDGSPYISNGTVRMQFIARGRGTTGASLLLDRVWVSTD